MRYIVVFIIACLVLLFACDSRDVKLQKQGGEIILKIEAYKNERGMLPNTLSDIGIIETEEGPLFYMKVDEVNYMVHYGTSLGESTTYYSDSKKWEQRFRGFESHTTD